MTKKREPNIITESKFVSIVNQSSKRKDNEGLLAYIRQIKKSKRLSVHILTLKERQQSSMTANLLYQVVMIIKSLKKQLISLRNQVGHFRDRK